jgi:DNA-binding response OmpR family regulator
MARRFSELLARPTTLAEAWRRIHGPRVLVVDADAALRDALGRSLTRRGLQVHEAQGAAELEELLHPASWHPERSPIAPDLIVLGDLPPAGLGALEALRRLRVVDQTTPVILLNTVDSPAAHLEASRLGVAAFLYHPVDVDEVGSLVACLVEEPLARERGGPAG